MNEYQIVSLISLLGFLILVTGAFRSHRVNVKKAFYMAAASMGGHFRNRRPVHRSGAVGQHAEAPPRSTTLFNIIYIIIPYEKDKPLPNSLTLPQPWR